MCISFSFGTWIVSQCIFITNYFSQSQPFSIWSLFVHIMVWNWWGPYSFNEGILHLAKLHFPFFSLFIWFARFLLSVTSLFFLFSLFLFFIFSPLSISTTTAAATATTTTTAPTKAQTTDWRSSSTSKMQNWKCHTSWHMQRQQIRRDYAKC